MRIIMSLTYYNDSKFDQIFIHPRSQISSVYHSTKKKIQPNIYTSTVLLAKELYQAQNTND